MHGTTASASGERTLVRDINRRTLLGWGSVAALVAVNGSAFGQDVSGESTWKQILGQKRSA